MRAPDERQAAVAYTYAWWLTGGDDAALAVLREVLSEETAAAAVEDPVTLLEGVRSRLSGARPMCPASELALLHDGLGVPLDAAAGLSSIAPDDSRVQLAHGRLEALLETVREDFAHPERLGGLAVANPPDVAHARQCPSCARASTLIERGRAELREVAALSPPPGLLARLAEPPAPPAADDGRDDQTVAVHELRDGPGPYAAAGDAALDAPSAPGDLRVVDDAAAEAAAPPQVSPGPPEAPPAPAPPPAQAPPAPAPRRVELSPGRRRLVIAMTGAGLVILFLIVPTLIATTPDAPTPTPTDATGPQPTTEPTEAGPQPTPTSGFGPPIEDTTEFSVADAGILLSGQTEPAPQGATVPPDAPLRVAVDYRNAAEGVQIQATWHVDGEPFQRLDAVVSGQSSRHVWGVPVPIDGWPQGQHRIVIAADGGVIGAVDFTVSASS